ncbi:MAG: hypothetical protein FWE07_09310 [Turicibacter sp.]|nr:hypothetical protein [Turicibacter sp.]
MEKGYLFILIGAIFTMFIRIPVIPIDILIFWTTRLPFWGFFLISFGMRQIMGTEKELRSAQLFTMICLFLRIGLPWLPNLGVPQVIILLLNLLFVFSPFAIFFWLFKSEYLWAPSSAKRMDWYIYTAIAAVYLVLNVVMMLPILHAFVPLTALQLINARQFINLLYNIVWIGLLLKLYLAARNESGARGWG